MDMRPAFKVWQRSPSVKYQWLPWHLRQALLEPTDLSILRPTKGRLKDSPLRPAPGASAKTGQNVREGHSAHMPVGREKEALGLLGVAIGIFGVTLSMLGLAIIQTGGTNFNPYVILGVAASLGGVLVALAAVLGSRSP